MAFELVAIWAIVTGVVIWFVRDEKRIAIDAELQRSARYYAHAPKYQHVARYREIEVAPVPLPPRRVGGLSAAQRAYIEAYIKS